MKRICEIMVLCLVWSGAAWASDANDVNAVSNTVDDAKSWLDSAEVGEPNGLSVRWGSGQDVSIGQAGVILGRDLEVGVEYMRQTPDDGIIDLAGVYCYALNIGDLAEDIASQVNLDLDGLLADLPADVQPQLYAGGLGGVDLDGLDGGYYGYAVGGQVKNVYVEYRYTQSFGAVSDAYKEGEAIILGARIKF